MSKLRPKKSEYQVVKDEATGMTVTHHGSSIVDPAQEEANLMRQAGFDPNTGLRIREEQPKTAAKQPESDNTGPLERVGTVTEEEKIASRRAESERQLKHSQVQKQAIEEEHEMLLNLSEEDKIRNYILFKSPSLSPEQIEKRMLKDYTVKSVDDLESMGHYGDEIEDIQMDADINRKEAMFEFDKSVNALKREKINALNKPIQKKVSKPKTATKANTPATKQTETPAQPKTTQATAPPGSELERRLKVLEDEKAGKTWKSAKMLGVDKNEDVNVVNVVHKPREKKSELGSYSTKQKQKQSKASFEGKPKVDSWKIVSVRAVSDTDNTD